MDILDELLEVEEKIAEFESHEGYHTGDRYYQDLLEKKSELERRLNEEA